MNLALPFSRDVTHDFIFIRAHGVSFVFHLLRPNRSDFIRFYKWTFGDNQIVLFSRFVAIRQPLRETHNELHVRLRMANICILRLPLKCLLHVVEQLQIVDDDMIPV